MTNQDIIEFQRTDREWRKSPLGSAFTKMTNALGRAWVADTESGFRENMSDKRLREIWDAERAATQAFRDLLDAQTKQHAEMLAALKASVELADRNLAFRPADKQTRSPECKAVYDQCVAAINHAEAKP